jgi:anti-sigma B factor antagonist/stage II sporulation protein AA (anti-sigma F factor antagonist)
MEDFERKVIKDIRIEVVNLSRATYKEANVLRKLLTEDIELHFKKLIVDISQCEFIDSTFIGALVVSLKFIAKHGGEIRLVKPSSEALSLMEIVGTLKIFNAYDTIEEAIASFDTA